MTGERLRAAVGIGLRQLSAGRLRTAMAVGGVALAVLLIVLLAGLGNGIATTGQEALTWIDQEVWVTQRPLDLAPGTVGGVQNTLTDAHAVSRSIAAHPEVASAEAIAFQAVYVGNGSGEYRTVVGVGVTGQNSSVTLGPAFERGDVHYANGSYDGPMTRAVIVSRSTAEMLNVTTGDRIHLGGTIAAAREREFRIVGVTGGYSNFLGTPTAVLHLSELQEVTGTTGADRASMIAVSLEPGADADTVVADLRRQYPDLRVRTQAEQYRATFSDRAAVIAGAVTLVVVAVVTGIGLVANVLALVVYEQRAAFAAARAAGVRTSTLAGVVGTQGLAIAAVGGALGVGLAPVAIEALNRLIASVVGFPNLIKAPPRVYGLGLGVALGIGLVGSLVASLRLSSVSPLAHMDR